MTGLFSKIFGGKPPKGETPIRENIPDADGDTLPDERPWTGVDLDGTLAEWGMHSTLDKIGPPVPVMLEYVQQLVADGQRVKIFTARAGDPEQIPRIQKWLAKHGLDGLEITNVKDYHMVRLFDDRCIQVEPNTGKVLSKLI